ncbi:hypothetical protein Bca52824_087882 [Brassica carinata]|uniref:Non-haem dioxygenase N-terminal domain-containing protein n=1 Tax=Brassica carinata TaxID=52824 RepID=A0A8X7P903_BRACI|nr:hypothetical protein Bca52824_087882 [Brassica carinata]
MGLACLEQGLFYVKSHGVPEELIEGSVFRDRKGFFNLPQEEKIAYNPAKWILLQTMEYYYKNVLFQKHMGPQLTQILEWSLFLTNGVPGLQVVFNLSHVDIGDQTFDWDKSKL